MSYAMPRDPDRKGDSDGPAATTIMVGNKDLDDGDRLVLSTWAGEAIPKRGSVFLRLTLAERKRLAHLMGMLNRE